jgi:hypothetical protein
MKKGSKHTLDTKIKNSDSHKGKRMGEENNKWKGDNVGYTALHDWVRGKLGKANKCENKLCLGVSKTYDWANISGEYKRDLKDWQQLCRSCHLKMDWRPKEFCRNGHLLVEVGIWIDSRGSRICKECKKENAKKDYKKNKEAIIARVTNWRRLKRSTIKRI